MMPGFSDVCELVAGYSPTPTLCALRLLNKSTKITASRAVRRLRFFACDARDVAAAFPLATELVVRGRIHASDMAAVHAAFGERATSLHFECGVMAERAELLLAQPWPRLEVLHLRVRRPCGLWALARALHQRRSPGEALRMPRLRCVSGSVCVCVCVCVCVLRQTQTQTQTQTPFVPL